MKFKNKFNKNFLTVVTGTSIAQLIPILISPLLTRLYTPSDFGIFGLYMSIVTIFSVVVTGRYELAIILPKKDSEGINIFALSLFVSMLVSSALFFLIFLSQYFAITFLDNLSINKWLLFVPLSTFLVGAYQSFNYWNNRKENYNRLSIGRIIQTLSIAIMSVFFAIVGMQDEGLILASIIGQTITTLILFILMILDSDNILKLIKSDQIKSSMSKYIKFPKFLILGHLMNTTSSQLPVILFFTFFTSTITGFFILTQRVISLPINVIALAIGDVFRQEASYQFARQKNCKTIFISTLKKLIFISFIPFIIFYFTAPHFFEFIFGADWIISGEFAQILVPMFFLQFISSPLSNMFIIAEKQEIDLFWQLFLLFIVTIALSIGLFVFNDPHLAVLLFSSGYSFAYIVNLFLTYHFAKGISN